MESWNPAADLAWYTGINQFGLAYQTMLENDSHAPGSVDRVLVQHMVRLFSETAAYVYAAYTRTDAAYQSGTRPKLERYVSEATTGRRSDEGRLEGIAEFCADLGKQVEEDLDSMLVGGTEEQIIERGSDWCTDVARVGCVLCQVAGFPSRIVYLADVLQAYSGHAIIEAHRGGVWGAVDPTTAVIYRSAEGKPVSTWDLMRRPELIERLRNATSAPYTRPGQFARAAISNYLVGDRGAYDYTVSPLNAYYRSILEMSGRGWPGGLRWLHREDGLPI